MTALTHTPSMFMTLLPHHTPKWYRTMAQQELAGQLDYAAKALLESAPHIENYRNAIKAWEAEIEIWLREYKAEQVKRKAAIANYNNPPPTPEDKRAYSDWEAEQQVIRGDMIRIKDWCDMRLRQLRELASEINMVARLRAEIDQKQQRIDRLEGYIKVLLEDQLAAPEDERDQDWIIEMQQLLLEDH